MSYYLKKTWDKTAQATASAYNSSVSLTKGTVSWASGSGSNSGSLITSPNTNTNKNVQPIFGVPLNKLSRRSPDLPPDVPLIVQMCVNFLMTKDERLRTEGLFRISGSSSKIEQLKNQFDTHNYPSLNELEITDTHAISGLLKLYFRSLPEPLLTYDLYPCFVACGAAPETDIIITSLRAALKMLPALNLKLIIYLCRLLHAVVENKEYNKMTSINLALIFAPTLLRAPKEGGEEENEFERAVRGLEDMKEANKLMEVMISEFDKVFEGIEEEGERDREKSQEVILDKSIIEANNNSPGVEGRRGSGDSSGGSRGGSAGASPVNRNSTDRSGSSPLTGHVEKEKNILSKSGGSTNK
eukprot:TRINITY_DN28015_c0_g1_i1.p1 TRINITY_DN28015_c0_g1~~TRINITY_DN28015_c0_g1_i1.p1  ORF type:complete len:356 (+),score=73.08 TRINITY_DN28015_c0_g1_i1:103-1170(+)